MILRMDRSFTRWQTALTGGTFRSGTGHDALACPEAGAWLPPHELVLCEIPITVEGRPFPLTPALSPGERENRIPIWNWPRRSGLSRDTGGLAPSPQGRGPG